MNEQPRFGGSADGDATGGGRVYREVVGERAGDGPAEMQTRSSRVDGAGQIAEPAALGVALGAFERQLAHLSETIERRGDADQLGRLSDSVESLADRLGRLERVLTLVSEERWNAARPTSRANPMTHPVTPVSRPAGGENREDALAGVRALFQAPARPWWQRLPGLQRG